MLAHMSSASAMVLILCSLFGGSIALGLTFIGASLRSKHMIDFIILCFVTGLAVISLPLYFYTYIDSSESMALYLIAASCILMLLECPTWILKREKTAKVNDGSSLTSHSSLGRIIRHNKQKNTLLLKICWYSVIGMANIVVICECMAENNIGAIIKNVLYLNSFLAVIVSQAISMGEYIPNVFKYAQKIRTISSSNQYNSLYSAVKMSESVGKPYSNTFSLLFIITNTICFTTIMIFSLYQITGLPAVLDLLLQQAGKQMVMLAYIGILLVYGWGISHKIWSYKFIWMTRKVRYRELAYCMYGAQTIALSLIMYLIPTFSDTAGITIHLKEMMFPYQMIEQCIKVLNCCTCSVVLFNMLFFISRVDTLGKKKLEV